MMSKTTWGRKESIVWPYQIPIYAYSSVFFALGWTFLFIVGWIHFALNPLQRYYLPLYERTSAIEAFNKTHRSTYHLLFVVGPNHKLSPALNDDVEFGRTHDPGGGNLPLMLSPEALARGNSMLIRGPLRSFSDTALNGFLREMIYGQSSIFAVFRVPLVAGGVLLTGILPFAVFKDTDRYKQLRYGRRLKGPEMMPPRQFNRIVKGDGIGFKIDGMRKLLRVPARAEAQHMQIIGEVCDRRIGQLTETPSTSHSHYRGSQEQ